MNLLYWNLKSNSNLESIINDCISENDVDIAIFSEYSNVDFAKLVNLLSSQYNILLPCIKIQSISPLLESNTVICLPDCTTIVKYI